MILVILIFVVVGSFIGYYFTGIGAIDNVELKNSKGEIKFHDDFWTFQLLLKSFFYCLLFTLIDKSHFVNETLQSRGILFFYIIKTLITPTRLIC